MKKRKAFEWAQERAARVFHEWANLPGYEKLDEDMAIALVVGIRRALLEAMASAAEEPSNG